VPGDPTGSPRRPAASPTDRRDFGWCEGDSATCAEGADETPPAAPDRLPSEAADERGRSFRAPPGQTSGGADAVRSDEGTAAALAHRRRIAEVFGDVLPDATGDDRPDPTGRSADDRWYLENRPPHH
jgi:hypothetical protein